MIKVEHNTVYLINDDNPNCAIRFCASYYFTDINIRIGTTIPTDYMLTVTNSKKSEFACFDHFFCRVMEQYDKEDPFSKAFYERIWFVDKYSNIITFYTDLAPIGKSNSFSIKKITNNGEEKFEISFYYIKGNNTEAIDLNNDTGQYSKYISFLASLHSELMNLAKEKPPVTQDEQGNQKRFSKPVSSNNTHN